MSEALLLGLRVSGWLAALALLAALSMTPLSRIVAREAGDRRALLVRARRWCGIASGVSALVHGALALAGYVGVTNLEALTEVVWLRSGALALAVLVPLLVTSFPAVTSALSVRLWKPLHRLSYLAVVLLTHHLVLAPFTPRWAVLTYGVGALVVLLARIAIASMRLRAQATALQGTLRPGHCAPRAGPRD